MTNIAEVIGWKFDHQPGMACKENDQGVVVITEFPGGIPSQADQDTWTAEYETHTAGPNIHPLNPFQFFTFLEQIGLSEAKVDQAIDQVESDASERIKHKRRFRHATSYRRDHPLLNSLVSAVGKTPAQIDTAWMAAKDLK